MNQRLECIVSGRVQMVMYRDFTRRAARTLGVVGFVENQRDGTVRVVAEGSEAQLSAFRTALLRGSPFSRVDKVEAQFTPATGTFSDFVIRYRNLIDRL